VYVFGAPATHLAAGINLGASGDIHFAWQGNGESNFRYNLELLEQITGLPVMRG
jgi:hypothetical protein